MMSFQAVQTQLIDERICLAAVSFLEGAKEVDGQRDVSSVCEVCDFVGPLNICRDMQLVSLYLILVAASILVICSVIAKLFIRACCFILGHPIRISMVALKLTQTNEDLSLSSNGH